MDPSSRFRSGATETSSAASTNVPSSATDDVVAEVIEATRRFAVASSLEFPHAASIVATCLLNSARSSSDAPASAVPDHEDGQPAVQLLSDIFRSTETVEGRLRVFVHLTSGPYPRYHALPGVLGYLLRTDSDGTQAIGRFVEGEFEVAD